MTQCQYTVSHAPFFSSRLALLSFAATDARIISPPMQSTMSRQGEQDVINAVKEIIEKSDKRKSVIDDCQLKDLYSTYVYPAFASRSQGGSMLVPYSSHHYLSAENGVCEWEWPLLEYAICQNFNSKPLLEMACSKIELPCVDPRGKSLPERCEYIFSIGLTFVPRDAWILPSSVPIGKADMAAQFLSMAFLHWSSPIAETLDEAFQTDESLTLMQTELQGCIVIYLMQRCRRPCRDVKNPGDQKIIACACGHTVAGIGLVIKFVYVVPTTEAWSIDTTRAYEDEFTTTSISGRGIGTMLIQGLQRASLVKDKTLRTVRPYPSIYLYSVVDKVDFWLKRGFKFTDRGKPLDRKRATGEAFVARPGFRVDSWPPQVTDIAGTEYSINEECRPMQLIKAEFSPNIGHSLGSIKTFRKSSFEVNEARYIAMYRCYHRVNFPQWYSLDSYPKEDSDGPVINDPVEVIFKVVVGVLEPQVDKVVIVSRRKIDSIKVTSVKSVLIPRL